MTLLLSSLVATPYIQAGCGATSASAGSDCTLAGSNYYNQVVSQDANSKLSFTAPDVTLENGIKTVISVTNGGTINFDNNANIKGSITGSNQAYDAVQINGGSMVVNGNLDVSSQMKNMSNNMAINNGNLTVAGDAHFEVLDGSTSGRVLTMSGNSQLKIKGDTTIVNNVKSPTSSTLTVIDSAKADFTNLSVTSHYKEAISTGGTATISSTGKTTINANSDGGSGIWFNDNALISLGEDEAVTQQLEAGRTGIGQINIGANATVSGARGIAINSSGTETHITVKGLLDSMSNPNYFGNQAIYGNSGKEVVTVLGNGQIYGHMDLRGGDDEVHLLSGLIETPETDGGAGLGIDMGAGNDYFAATGGVLKTPSVKMGTGQDKALLADKVDITGLAQIDGGADGSATNTGELTIRGLTLEGYTNNTVQAGKGLDMTNWNTIHLTSGTALSLSDKGLFSTNTAATNPNALNIDASSILQTTDTAAVSNQTIFADVDNSGTINLSNNKTLSDSWTIEGNYKGNSGLVKIDTRLNGDGSPTDKLVITGDTAGTTNVHVNNLGGLGAKTVEGIEVVEVRGDSAGQFKQDGRIVAGAYDYTLGRGNAVNGTDNKNWYLTSFLSPLNPKPTVRPEAGSYLTLIENQGAFNHSFHDRQQMLDNQYQTVWTRVKYSRTKAKSEGDIDNRNDQDLIQFGTDIYQNDQLHLGIMGGYVRSDLNSHSRLTGYDAKGKSDGYSAGVYGTWYDQTADQSGLYVDTYALYNWFDNEVNGKGLDKEKYHSNGYTLSAETGYSFIVGQTKDTQWQVEPQAQVIYNSFNGKTHREKNGTNVRISDTDNITSRLGLRIEGKRQGFQPFVTFNYWHNSDIARISMNQTNLQSDKARDLYEIKTGGQMAITDKLTVYGQLEGALGSKSTKQYGGSLGIKYNW